MISKRYIVCLLLCLCALSSYAQEERWGMNNPYIDDKLFHFGYQIGLVCSSYLVNCSEDSVTVWSKPGNVVVARYDTLHAQVSMPGVGLRIRFITDLRLCKYLNLRFIPGFEFRTTTLNYKSVKGLPIQNMSGNKFNEISVMALPVDLPLYLKFSAERDANYRPYVIAGGGVSFNILRPKREPVLLSLSDYFCEVGFGCDLYFRWFKLCPELTYRIGFSNQIVPISERKNDTGDAFGYSDVKKQSQDRFYTNAISTMTYQAICLTFNFE